MIQKGRKAEAALLMIIAISGSLLLKSNTDNERLCHLSSCLTDRYLVQLQGVK